MKLRKRVASIVAAIVVSTTAMTAVMAPTPAQAAPGDPVIIVAGTFGFQAGANYKYAELQRRLQASGRRTYIFGLPGGGLGDARDTAAGLDNFVASVRAETGAARVDIVAHSQGAMISRYYIKYLGGAAEVDTLVSLGGVQYGTNVANLVAWLGGGDCGAFISCTQMTVGSAFLNDLNAGDDSFGNVSYANIASSGDNMINPWTNGFLRSNDGNSVNSNPKDWCRLRRIDHSDYVSDGAVYSGIAKALAHQPISYNCLLW
jgi:triacylglycerol lipase